MKGIIPRRGHHSASRSRIIVEVAVVPPAIAGPVAAVPVAAPLEVAEAVAQEPGLLLS